MCYPLQDNYEKLISELERAGDKKKCATKWGLHKLVEEIYEEYPGLEYLPSGEGWHHIEIKREVIAQKILKVGKARQGFKKSIAVNGRKYLFIKEYPASRRRIGRLDLYMGEDKEPYQGKRVLSIKTERDLLKADAVFRAKDIGLFRPGPWLSDFKVLKKQCDLETRSLRRRSGYDKPAGEREYELGARIAGKGNSEGIYVSVDKFSKYVEGLRACNKYKRALAIRNMATHTCKNFPIKLYPLISNALRRAAEDPDPGIRTQAVLAMIIQQVSFIEEKLNDEDHCVRAAAAYALGVVGEGNANSGFRGSLMRMLELENSPFAKRYALESLEKIPKAHTRLSDSQRENLIDSLFPALYMEFDLLGTALGSRKEFDHLSVSGGRISNAEIRKRALFAYRYLREAPKYYDVNGDVIISKAFPEKDGLAIEHYKRDKKRFSLESVKFNKKLMRLFCEKPRIAREIYIKAPPRKSKRKRKEYLEKLLDKYCDNHILAEEIKRLKSEMTLAIKREKKRSKDLPLCPVHNARMKRVPILWGYPGMREYDVLYGGCCVDIVLHMEWKTKYGNDLEHGYICPVCRKIIVAVSSGSSCAYIYKKSKLVPFDVLFRDEKR